MIDASFAPDMFSREVLNIWLTLWGEIANNPVLQAEHRRQYATYIADVTAALDQIAADRALTIDSATLARAFIALVDGLGLQRCIEPRLMTPKSAKAACYALLEPHLGKL